MYCCLKGVSKEKGLCGGDRWVWNHPDDLIPIWGEGHLRNSPYQSPPYLLSIPTTEEEMVTSFISFIAQYTNLIDCIIPNMHSIACLQTIPKSNPEEEGVNSVLAREPYAFTPWARLFMSQLQPSLFCWESTIKLPFPLFPERDIFILTIIKSKHCYLVLNL